MLLQRLVLTRLWIIIIMILVLSPALWFAGCKNFVILHQWKAGLHEKEPLAIAKISWLPVNTTHDTSVLTITGWSYQKLGDLTSAQKYLELAVQLQPHYTRAWFLLGNVRLEVGDEAGAIEAFKTAGAGQWLSWQGL